MGAAFRWKQLRSSKKTGRTDSIPRVYGYRGTLTAVEPTRFTPTSGSSELEVLTHRSSTVPNRSIAERIEQAGNEFRRGALNSNGLPDTAGPVSHLMSEYRPYQGQATPSTGYEDEDIYI